MTKQVWLRSLFKRRETVVYSILAPTDEPADETLRRLNDGEGEVVHDWAKKHPLLAKHEDIPSGRFRFYRADKVDQEEN